jgi:hypothetical protein
MKAAKARNEEEHDDLLVNSARSAGLVDSDDYKVDHQHDDSSYVDVDAVDHQEEEEVVPESEKWNKMNWLISKKRNDE